MLPITFGVVLLFSSYTFPSLAYWDWLLIFVIKEYYLKKSLTTVAQDHVQTRGIRTRQAGW